MLQHFLHAIVIVKLEHRRANNVVETRANTAAGDNGRLSFTRFEEQSFAGTGLLEVNFVRQIIARTGLDLMPYARIVWNKGAASFATAPRELQRRDYRGAEVYAGASTGHTKWDKECRRPYGTR
jgi:hypothetical protein